MRVSVTSEASVVTELAGEVSHAPDAEVKDVVVGGDLTEQKFGIAEVATLIAIVNGGIDLAKMLVSLVRKAANREPEATQSLRIKTSLGAVSLELSPDVTVDELLARLAPLFSA